MVESWTLTIEGEKVNAWLLEWLEANVALFRLATPARHMPAGSLVLINMNTMEVTIVKEAA